jgi:O-antigen ligase
MDSPLWGVGPGSGRLIYSQYAYTAAEEGWELDKKHIVWHSPYLHVGAETGAIGLAA